MKVLFTFGGLPHYYNRILNRLNSIEDLEVIVVNPEKKSATIGEGVHQTKTDIQFKIIHLMEYKTYFGKLFFKNFKSVLEKEEPKIIVTIWPYVLGFFFNPILYMHIKRKNIKIIFKDIPFQLPKYENTINFYKNHELFTEEKGYTKEAQNFKSLIKYKLLSYVRKFYFNFVDAHVDYTENAFEILKSYGVLKEKIFIIYNSPDSDFLLSVFDEIKSNDLILPENNFRIIHVGRLVKWKRVDLLIDAFKDIKNNFKDAQLVVIGTGPEEVNLQKQAEDLNLIDSIKFVGAVYDPKILGRYLHASAVYVLAGMGGLSINEAMCFEKPIVCSVCDGTEKKLVRDGFNGKYFRLNDKSDLAEKINYLLSNQDLIRQMGKNSGKIIREEINVNTVINGYIRAFKYCQNL